MTLDSLINIVYIGAGSITFGVPYEPWNHSLRVEKLLGDRLRVVAIIDPNEKRVNQILDDKQSGEYAQGYKDTKHFFNVEDAHACIQDENIDLFIIGAPPLYRGTTNPGHDLELKTVKLFGDKPVYFTEKPVSSTRPEEPYKVSQRLGIAQKNIGVGYMMRYLKVVQKAKQILTERKLVPTAITARYAMAYELTRKPEWWAKSGQGGPAVEQMTHFCDLMRYIAGEVQLNTVSVATVEHDTPAGSTIDPQYIDETQIEMADRVPRVTSAQWRFLNGALASFTHIISLYGQDYADEIAIFAQGHQLRIQNVYTVPTLYVRDPEHEKDELVYRWDDDDVFYDEMRAFISVAARRSGKPDLQNMDQELAVSDILSSYEDACRTFELTWRIRDKGDEYAKWYRSQSE